MRTLMRSLAAMIVGLLTMSCNEQPRACGLGKTCPPQTHCIDGLCQNLPWWSDVAEDDALGVDCSMPDNTTSPAGRSALGGGWVNEGFEIFGGNPELGGVCDKPGSSSWTAHRWRPCKGWQAHAGPVPLPRESAASTGGFDSVWMFGGRRRDKAGGPWSLYGDLWRLSGSPARWTLTSTADAPLRHGAAIAAQVEPPSVWVFGGDAAINDQPSIYLQDIRRYRLDQNQWELPPTTGSFPSARSGHGLVALQSGKTLIMFGGKAANGLTADTWQFDTKKMSWKRLDLSGPSARHGFSMAQSQGTVWLFGGRDDSEQKLRNDLWRFTSTAGWERIRVGDLGAQATVGGVLEPQSNPCIPTDKWVQIDADSPARRSHALISAHAEGLWLFGGRGSCGPLADLWRLDLSSFIWELRGPADQSYPCPRRASLCQAWCTPP